MSPEDVAAPLAKRSARRGDYTMVAAVLAVAAVAWVVLSLTHGTADHGSHLATPSSVADLTTQLPGGGHHHDRAAQVTLGDATHVSATSVAIARGIGWVLMVVAMMLPSAIPLLRVVRRLAGGGPRGTDVVVAVSAAFVGMWSLAGTAYVVVDRLLRGAVDAGWLTTHATLVVAVVTVAAGVWQFTPAKRACLTSCRSPVGVAMTRWGRGRPAADAARIGAAYAIVCIGCCWALMALTLVVGLPAMPLMVVMSLVMALERMLPRVRPFVPAIGVAAIALGLAVLAGLVPAAWLT